MLQKTYRGNYHPHENQTICSLHSNGAYVFKISVVKYLDYISLLFKGVTYSWVTSNSIILCSHVLKLTKFTKLQYLAHSLDKFKGHLFNVCTWTFYPRKLIFIALLIVNFCLLQGLLVYGLCNPTTNQHALKNYIPKLNTAIVLNSELLLNENVKNNNPCRLQSDNMFSCVHA